MAWRIPLPSCSADSHLAQTAACTTPGAADCGSDGCCATQMRPPRPQPDDVSCSRPPLLLDLAADPAVRDLIKPYGSYGNTNLNAVKQALSRLGYDTAGKPDSVSKTVRRIVQRVFSADKPGRADHLSKLASWVAAFNTTNEGANGRATLQGTH